MCYMVVCVELLYLCMVAEIVGAFCVNMCEYLSELFESCVKLFENMCVWYKRIFVKYILHFVFVFSLEKSVLKISKNAENISGSGDIIKARMWKNYV